MRTSEVLGYALLFALGAEFLLRAWAQGGRFLNLGLACRVAGCTGLGLKLRALGFRFYRVQGLVSLARAVRSSPQ